MEQKLDKNQCFYKAYSKFIYSMLFLLGSVSSIVAQSEGPKPPRVTDYKDDSTYKYFNKLNNPVAYAQINELKKNGALLVRLKTNSNTINRLKNAGNSDLAIQLEKETELKNKIIMASYLQEFDFCPVYFFFSDVSDSVKHKKLDGIFVDTTLNVNPNIVCDKSFYLVAEDGIVYNSSLGFVPEASAAKASEHGSVSREAPIVIKNRYFIQLHKPFPFFQIRASNKKTNVATPGNYNVNWDDLSYRINKITNHSREAKELIKFRYVVRALNANLEEFYTQHAGFVITPDIKPFIY